MYFGRVMEVADRDVIYGESLHPYTKVLLDAAPVPDPTIEKSASPALVQGRATEPSWRRPTGCVFNTRCPLATQECRQVIPQLEEKKPGHLLPASKSNIHKKRRDNWRVQMESRRTTLKKMAGAFALGVSGLSLETVRAEAQSPKKGGTP